MRTGAIFARGSCRALMWVLVLGTAVVLSAGEAAGQATSVTVSRGTVEVEEGGTASINVSLNRPPTATATAPAVAQGTVTATITIASDNNGASFVYTLNGTVVDLTGTATTITFNPGVTPTVSQLAILSAEDDNAMDGRVVLSITAAGDSGSPAIAPKTVIVTEDDNDEVRVNVAPRSLIVPEGGMDTYSIGLGSLPTNDVTVTLRVTNVNAAVSARMLKVDTTATPPTDVLHSSIVFTTDAAAAGTSPTDNIVMWNESQTVRVSAGEDVNTISGSATIRHIITTVDADYATSTPPSVTVTEIDSVRTITVDIAADSVMEGEPVSITATLGHADVASTNPLPLSEPVTVALALRRNPAAAGSYSPSAPTITIPAGQMMGMTTLNATHDGDDDDESLTFDVSVSGSSTVVLGDAATVKLAIEDDDTYTLTAGKSKVNEGDEVTLTVEVDPKAALDTDVRVELYQASGATVEPGPGDVPDHVTIKEGESEAEFTLKTARDGDSNDETIVVRAKVGTAIVGENLTITVLDGLDYTISLEPDSIGEADGEASVMLKVETNKAISSTKDTTVKFAVEPDSTATDPDDYTIMPESGMIEVMIEKGMTMGMTTFMVTPVMDSMDEPNETIKLSGWVDDKLVGDYVNLTIIDGDSPGSGITPKSDEEVGMVFTDAIEMAGGLMVGGNMVSVDMSMLFDMANSDMEVMYTASSSDESVLGASSSGSMLTLDPMMAGMSTVSVEAKPAGMGSASVTVSAFTCTGACVSVNLDVAAAISFMLEGPEDMNIPEGMSAMVTVTASSAVVADTEVMLMRDGTSTASADDYSIEPMMATIMAGETMAEFEVMALEDDMMESDGNMAEMLTLFLVVDDMQMDQSVSFYLWDAAVPALPVIAQLLLAAFLAVGGYRRYLRR